jgi:hypothetical protein
VIDGTEDATAPFPFSRFPPPFSCSLAMPPLVINNAKTGSLYRRIETEDIQTSSSLRWYYGLSPFFLLKAIFPCRLLPCVLTDRVMPVFDLGLRVSTCIVSARLERDPDLSAYASSTRKASRISYPQPRLTNIDRFRSYLQDMKHTIHKRGGLSEDQRIDSWR